MYNKIFELPQLTINITFHMKHEQEKFIVAGGRKPEKNWLKQAAGKKEVYCADRGIEYCLDAGIKPMELYGDGDSANSASYCIAQEAGVKVNTFNPEKDDTDLQLLLNSLFPADLIISGVWGGRFDHLYSNVFSLLGYKIKHSAQVLLADDKEIILLLSAGEEAVISLKNKDSVQAVSLLPLYEDAIVDFNKVKWELKDAELRVLYPYAISNLPEKEFICVCKKGYVGLYLSFNL